MRLQTIRVLVVFLDFILNSVTEKDYVRILSFCLTSFNSCLYSFALKTFACLFAKTIKNVFLMLLKIIPRVPNSYLNSYFYPLLIFRRA